MPHTITFDDLFTPYGKNIIVYLLRFYIELLFIIIWNAHSDFASLAKTYRSLSRSEFELEVMPHSRYS